MKDLKRRSLNPHEPLHMRVIGYLALFTISFMWVIIMYNIGSAGQ